MNPVIPISRLIYRIKGGEQLTVHNEEKQDLKYVTKNREIALEELMVLFGEELKRLIYLYVKDRAITEDLVQEVFVSIYLKLDSYNGDSSIKSWIYSIAINKCKDYLKSWNYRKIISMNVFSIFEKEDGVSPEEYTIVKDENSLLFHSILSLPIKYREVLIFYYYKDLSIEEISKVVGINPSTVKTRLRRSREKLKQLLPEEKGREFFGS